MVGKSQTPAVISAAALDPKPFPIGISFSISIAICGNVSPTSLGHRKRRSARLGYPRRFEICAASRARLRE